MWILERRRVVEARTIEVWTYFSESIPFNLDKLNAQQFADEASANLYNMQHLQGLWTAVRIDAPRS